MLAAAVAVAVSANTIPNGFVFDDVQNVLENEWVRNPSRLAEAFTHHMTGFNAEYAPAYYRPLLHVALAGCHAVSGLSPWAFHLLNVLLHGMVSALVFVLVARCDDSGVDPVGRDPARRPGPWLASLLFAVHPIHTDAVAWISDVAVLGSSLFFLLALLVGMRLGGRLGPVASALLLFIALLFKEPAVTLPAVLAIVLATRGDFGSERRRQSLATVGAVLLAVVAYLALRAHALGTLVGGDGRYEVGPGPALMTAVALVGEYASKVVAPRQLSVLHDYRVVTEPGSVRLWCGLAVAMGLAAVAWRWRGRPGVLCGVTLVAIPLVPALYVPGVSEGIFAERYFYLPLAGVAILTGALADGAWARVRSRPIRVAVIAGACTLLAGLSVIRVDRNAVWRTSLSLWTDTAHKVPNSPTALEYLGHAQLTSGRPAEAIATLSRALELKPDRTDTRTNLGSALLAAERPGEAAEQLEFVVRLQPGNALASMLLGDALARQGRFPEAVAALERAAALDPGVARAHGLLGSAYAAMGRTDEAIAQFAQAARLEPDNAMYSRALDFLTR